MKIIVEDIYSTVHGVDLLRHVKAVCKARPDGYQYMSRYRSGMWDGYISLMLGFSKFPTGLLSKVLKELHAKNISATVEYEISRVDHDIVVENYLNGIILRDNQLDAIHTLLQRGRGIAKMATNSGKTEVFSAIIKAINKKTVVIVDSKELLYQTKERIEHRTGMNVGLIGDGIYDPDNITVCMIQTLYNRFHKSVPEHFSDNVVVIVDECHHVSSGRMLDVLFKLPGCYRYGFSGTPLKYDKLNDLKVIAATGDILVNVTNDDLIDAGYSAKPYIHLHIVEDVDDDKWGMDYMFAYDDYVVNNDQRNVIISNICKKSDGVILIFVNRVEHGKILHNLIPDSVLVTGSSDIKIRKQVLIDMNTVPGVYIATPIFDEGVDVPSIDTIILAAGGKSHIKVLQRIGRGLRKKDGNNVLTVHDFIDDTNKYLFKHSMERIKVYEQEKFDMEIAE
jgi:superfamily II DNA or RNA helicase